MESAADSKQMCQGLDKSFKDAIMSKLSCRSVEFNSLACLCRDNDHMLWLEIQAMR